MLIIRFLLRMTLLLTDKSVDQPESHFLFTSTANYIQ